MVPPALDQHLYRPCLWFINAISTAAMFSNKIEPPPWMIGANLLPKLQELHSSATRLFQSDNALSGVDAVKSDALACYLEVVAANDVGGAADVLCKGGERQQEPCQGREPYRHKGHQRGCPYLGRKLSTTRQPSIGRLTRLQRLGGETDGQPPALSSSRNRLSRLRCHSRLMATRRFWYCSAYSSLHSRPLVDLAPVPVLWAFSRLSRLVVHPQ